MGNNSHDGREVFHVCGRPKEQRPKDPTTTKQGLEGTSTTTNPRPGKPRQLAGASTLPMKAGPWCSRTINLDFSGRIITVTGNIVFCGGESCFEEGENEEDCSLEYHGIVFIDLLEKCTLLQHKQVYHPAYSPDIPLYDSICFLYRKLHWILLKNHMYFCQSQYFSNCSCNEHLKAPQYAHDF